MLFLHWVVHLLSPKPAMAMSVLRYPAGMVGGGRFDRGFLGVPVADGESTT